MFVDVRLLGPVHVLDRSGQKIQITGERPRALVGVLALESPASVSRGRIVDAPCGDAPPDSLEPSLPTVPRLRGAGVTQTARIEPRTPEGEVYGTLPTAKGYGPLPLYAVHQKVY